MSPRRIETNGFTPKTFSDETSQDVFLVDIPTAAHILDIGIRKMYEISRNTGKIINIPKRKSQKVFDDLTLLQLADKTRWVQVTKDSETGLTLLKHSGCTTLLNIPWPETIKKHPTITRGRRKF